MTAAAAPRVAAKWRPPLALVVAAVLALVASLPLGAIVLFRVWDNQLLRRTEAELAAQSAAPEEMPTSSPSTAATSRAAANASSFFTVMISSYTLVLRTAGTNPAPMP